MAENRVAVTLQLRNSTAETWTTRNPTLRVGEFGLENDTFRIKIGDGVRDWQHLPYLNKLDSSYFKYDTDGSLTFSDDFATNIQNLLEWSGVGGGSFIIENDPTNPTDPVNLRYLEWAIAHAGHLKRAVVQALPTEDIDENTLYMVLAQSGDHYEEYMYINGAWDMVGTTGDGGSSGGYTLAVATAIRLGGVKSAPLDNEGHILTDDDYIVVNENTGFMTLSQVSTSRLYVPTGDTLVLYGGTA